jgi:hypothetical protein
MTMSRRASASARAAVALAATGCLLAPRTAAAFERQWHVGLDGGYAVQSGDPVSGFGGGAHAAYGLSDSFNAMLELGVTHHPGATFSLRTGDGARVMSLETIASGALGIAYTIDVARAVPYVGVLAGTYRLGELSGSGWITSSSETGPSAPSFAFT